jgi:hypothetical protein
MDSLHFPCLICFVANATDLAATQEVANGLEKFDQFIVVINNALDRLTCLVITKMRTQGQTKVRTERAEQRGLSVLPLQAVNAVGCVRV